MNNAITPTDGMVITADTHFAEGVFNLPHGIKIAADHITITGDNTHIVSPNQTGTGIHIDGHKNVTIRNLTISGYYHGIRADRCENVILESVTVRNTYEIEGIETFLYLWRPIDEVYSGAILFNAVQNGKIAGCDLQHQMNGILLYHSDNILVEKNNASFNSGWGVYLSATSDSTVQDNQLDFCNRVFRRPEDGSIRVEADAAGIVLVKGASRNRFLRNSCLCGGDGIFVAGYEHPGKIDPCNDNLFEENDCRLSPNNAIESTFSRGNIFRRNDCSRSNYGMWMGFSWDNVIEDNEIDFNRWAGIAIEHGFDFTIRNNRIRNNGEGVRLWTRGGVIAYWPGHEVCYNFTLRDNEFVANNVGFVGDTGDDSPDKDCHNFHLRGNRFDDNRVGARFARVTASTLHNNRFENNLIAAIQLQGNPQVDIADNEFESNRTDTENLA